MGLFYSWDLCDALILNLSRRAAHRSRRLPNDDDQTEHPWSRPAASWAIRTSNGMLAEVNSHDWDTTRWLMMSNHERVYAEVANLKGAANNVDTPNFYDNVLVNVKFEGGGLGMISGVCPCGYGYDARVEIIGDKGIMQIGELKGQQSWSAQIGIRIDHTHLPTYAALEWAYINDQILRCVYSNETKPRVDE
jgi:predicted dehydrogenase